MAPRKHAFGGLSMSDAELMAAALLGLEHQRSEIEEQMAEVRRVLRKTDLSGSDVPQMGPMSAAGRERIAAAQRKRWAAVKKAKKTARK
jgi:hypothetical protein